MKDPLLIAKRQEGNPLLKFLNVIKKEWSDSEATVADYSIGNKVGVLFLTIKYHRQNPNYIHDRIKNLRGNFPTRILLLLVNSDQPDSIIEKLTILGIANNINLVLAFDYEEAARWLISLYDTQENTSDFLKATNESNYNIAVDALHALGASTKEADALLDNFSTLADILLCTDEQIADTGCLSTSKIEILTEATNKPFQLPTQDTQ
ncbi:Mating-type switching protein swi10 [Tritrichomonas foetus]|uniref:Mating-type switching protein swi10 n=1 Tax=Tritrichomonas foetus TaxID=1144522 RepID=A0A1J4K086_9EUKA|nr:Mating-type switching protein swi10 [Tritrichomonas foetus]|eukprot:OHT04831.1 Mating-type switching protein swi10 [Tritrichomonas foetus]